MPRSLPVNQIAPVGVGTDQFGLAYPLNEFYRRNRHSLPPLEEIDPARIPEPYKRLLVHQHDMTSTLENFHAGRIRLEIVGRDRQGPEYFREVALLIEQDKKPVEFGAIKINLDLFPESAQAAILAEHWPLGRILKEAKIEFSSQPRGFLRIASDKVINEVLHLTGAHLLFGRRNTLWNRTGQPLAEIVEILPPA